MTGSQDPCSISSLSFRLRTGYLRSSKILTSASTIVAYASDRKALLIALNSISSTRSSLSSYVNVVISRPKKCKSLLRMRINKLNCL